MKFHFVLLTKCYDRYDLLYWFEYHCKRFPEAEFHIFDNDSYVDIRQLIDPSRYTYNRIAGFPDQKKLYSDIMNGKYGEFFEQDDLVAFIDDDEYLYANDKNYDGILDLERVMELCRTTEYNTLCLPHINISSKELLNDRNTSMSMPSTLTYRRADTETTVKCIVRYGRESRYEWKSTPDDPAGHVPYVNGVRKACVFTGWVGKDEYGRFMPNRPEVLTFPLRTSMASVDYTSNIRLYHYHLKSRWDWSKKIERGSCARVIPWYSKDIEKNMFYGKYDILDEDMKTEFENYVTPAVRDNHLLHDEYSVVSENDTTLRKSAYIRQEHEHIDYEALRFATTFDDKIALGKKWIKENAPYIDIENPKNICDWINYYKFNDLNPQKILWSDKCAVYKELYDIGLEHIRIPVIYERYKPSDKEISEAVDICSKNDCILKCNHGSGYNIKFSAGEPVNRKYLVKKIREWLDTNYAYIAGYEWQYEPIVPAIIVQPVLSKGPLVDYQFFCLDGKVEAVDLQKKVSKVIITHLAFTDTGGNDLSWYIGGTPLQRGLTDDQKKAIKTMLPAVEKIAALFKFVRVDMFWTGGRVYFCEATFCPCSGVLNYTERR